MPKMHTLNIRLMRNGRSINSAFTETFSSGQERELAQQPWNAIEGAIICFGQIYSNTPSWLPFISEGTPNIPVTMFTGGAGAAIFIPIDGCFLVVCFGHMHIALNDDAFERQFGLMVTLNSVPRSQLRTLDLATPDAVTFQKRVQASRDSDIHEFGVDMLRDLARVAGGTPENEAFARFVAGKDSLSITCAVDVSTLQAKCVEIMAVYNQKNYQRDFSWIDNMRIVNEKDTLEMLYQKLFESIEALRAGNSTDLHMAPPEIVNYIDGSQLHYNGFGSHGKKFYSLSIEDYVSELNRCGFDGNISDIRDKHRIKTIRDGEDEFSEKWRVMDCFVFETALGGGEEEQHYVLFAGNWYRVDRNFKKRIENFFNLVNKVSIIRRTLCHNEEELIDEISKTRPDLLKLDRTKINPGGARYANLEPCDFLSKNKQFIHLKDGHSSGSISHLWSQGIVSAEAFVSDPVFRKKLREKVKSLGGGFESFLPKSTDKIIREDYCVVYGVMRKPRADGTLDLPFFSKISLQAAANRLEHFGIPLALELIEKPASAGHAAEDEDD